MLKFNNAWRFHPPAIVDYQVINEFSELIGKIAAQGDLQEVLEHFKHYFAGAAGATSTWSSNASWAETDLHSNMSDAAKNAPLFIAGFYDACETLRAKNPDIYTPDAALINGVLARHGVEFELRPPNLVARDTLAVPIPVPPQPPSLDEQAQEIVQRSLLQSEQFLSEGRDRQAVQEILWLLETVSTAFQGLDTGTGTVQGKYFNKIADDLRRLYKGKTLEQVLDWVKTLHGYFSSTTGGGVRHGRDIRAGMEIQPNEARLFCNLIRSYISFLIMEHERLNKK
jgi:hypothetical protein